MGVPGGDRGAETSPLSPGVPGGEPEPAHPQQQRLGAVSVPLLRFHQAFHHVPCMVLGAWHTVGGRTGASVCHTTLPTGPAPCCAGLEQGMAETGLQRSVPIPGASSGTSPSLCHAEWLDCRRLSRWVLCMSPAVPGGSARLCPPVEPWPGRRGAGAQGPACSLSSQCRRRCQHSFLVVHFPNSLAGLRLQTAYF